MSLSKLEHSADTTQTSSAGPGNVGRAPYSNGAPPHGSHVRRLPQPPPGRDGAGIAELPRLGADRGSGGVGLAVSGR
jgi:hypothetical protein